MNGRDFRAEYAHSLKVRRGPACSCNRHSLLTVLQAASLPATFSIPNDPPIYDQGQLGSCTANAWGGAEEIRVRQEGATDFLPSRLGIYYDERVIEGDPAEDGGAQIHTGGVVLQTKGGGHDSLWPYNTAAFAQQPTAAYYADAAGYEAQDFGTVAQDLNAIKAAVFAGHPVVFGFEVFANYFNIGADGLVPAPAGQIEGGHAQTIIGWDDATAGGVFIVRNSWGTDFGKGGYVLLPYSQALDQYHFDYHYLATLSTPQPAPTPTPAPPQPTPPTPTPTPPQPGPPTPTPTPTPPAQTVVLTGTAYDKSTNFDVGPIVFVSSGPMVQFTGSFTEKPSGLSQPFSMVLRKPATPIGRFLLWLGNKL